MSRIEVEPGRLHATGAEIAVVGTEAARVGGQLGGEGAGLAAAAGFPEAGGPLGELVSSWARGVAETGEAVETLGTLTQAAGSAYRDTDAASMPARGG